MPRGRGSGLGLGLETVDRKVGKKYKKIRKYQEEIPQKSSRELVLKVYEMRHIFNKECRKLFINKPYIAGTVSGMRLYDWLTETALSFVFIKFYSHFFRNLCSSNVFPWMSRSQLKYNNFVLIFTLIFIFFLRLEVRGSDWSTGWSNLRQSFWCRAEKVPPGNLCKSKWICPSQCLHRRSLQKKPPGEAKLKLSLCSTFHPLNLKEVYRGRNVSP